MGGILERLRRFRIRAFGQSLEPEREVDTLDAAAAAHGHVGHIDPQSGTGNAGYPPDYVKTDDGRPRH
jgi:hypothetical protein